MGKRKLAVFFRKYVTAKLSRRTKKKVGAFRSHDEGHQNSTAPTRQATKPQANSDQRNGSFEVVPVTKIPALDTIDQYVAGPATEGTIDRSPRVELSWSSDARTVIDDLMQGYARFISSFTGLQDIAFVLSLRSPFAAESKNTHSVVCATIAPSGDNQEPGDQSRCMLREVDFERYNKDEVQFFAELGSSCDHEKEGRKAPWSTLENIFTLFAEPDIRKNTLHISFEYPRRLIPEPAVNQILHVLATSLADSSPTLALSTMTPPVELSILNFPPCMAPPSRHPTQNGNIDTTSMRRHLLHSAFEDCVRKKPSTIALDFVHSLPSKTSPAEHSTLTYATLDAAASNLAVRIRSLLSGTGLASEYGSIIPVHMPTSPELYISYLGILKAGYAFSPIPQDAPPQRILQTIKALGSPILLGNTPEPASYLSHSGAIDNERKMPIWVDVTDVSKWKELCRDRFTTALTSKAPIEQLDIREDQTAYLLFTSGSTGQPKGVQISHLAGTCSIESHIAEVPLPGDPNGGFRWFQFASPSFDPSIMEIFVTLSTGGTLCSADRNLSLSNLEATINEARATVMMSTPSLASILRPSHLTTLQSLWSMGEKLNRTVIEKFSPKPEDDGAGALSNLPPALVNAYGPTEGAINCTISAPFTYNTRGSIIGKALPTCTILIICPNSPTPRLVPSGLVGELVIGGPQVSKGYFNLPRETEKSFIHSTKFGYLYRTGDRARIVWDQAGSPVIEYLGRITTDQVKVSGRRVELGEIESAITTVPSVREAVAVVLMRDDKLEGGEQIIACLVINDKCEETKRKVIQQVQKKVKEHLTPSMFPSGYTFFESLPRSGSGKVDRKAISARLQRGENESKILPAVEYEKLGNGAIGLVKTQDPATIPLQQLVTSLIAETVGESTSAVNPGDDLFSMGMDSLNAVKLLQKMRDHTIGGLSVADVLQSQTPMALATVIANRQKSEEENQAPIWQTGFSLDITAFGSRNRPVCAKKLNLASDKIEKVLPATATQCSMLTSFLGSLADRSSTTRNYIYHSVLSLPPQVNLEQMKTAWETIIATYDSFRTVFCSVDDDIAPFSQCILTQENAPRLDWKAFSAYANGHPEETALQKALSDAEDTIDVDSPWKISLVQSPTRSQILLSMFHGIFDGGSLKLLLEDVSSVYTGKPLAERKPLDYIVKHHFQTDHISTSRFWGEYLENYSPVTFPSLTSYQRPSIKATGCVEISSLTNNYHSLKRRAKSIGSTPLSVLQAAWSSILFNYTGAPDQEVVLGSVVSGRLDEDSATCIGPTFTVIPVRVSIGEIYQRDGNPITNVAIARHLASFNAKALSHLQPRLGSINSADGQIPYDTVLAYQDFRRSSSSTSHWNSIVHPPMATDFTVMVEVIPEDDSSLTFRANFNEKLDSISAEMMLKEMDDIVNFILDNPNGNFEDASFHPRSDLKSAFNPTPKTASEVAGGYLLHSQFEEHAKSNPSDIALIFKRSVDNEQDPGNVNLTYSELNAMADNLAEHLLRICGSLTNSTVPICIEKSPELYVAILGILKAGGAWCPIDTHSPTQRRHDLIARTSSGVLLVSNNDGAQPDGAVPAATKVINVSQFSDNCYRNPDTAEPKLNTSRASPDNIAYLIWTSGTTGAPKGVPITHSAAVSSMRSLQKDIPVNADGSPVRCLQFSQCTFDVSIQDLFYTWGVGGVLISASRDVMLGSFSTLANITNATHAHLTPAFAAGVPRKSCQTLKVITMIGEKLTQPVADDWGTNMRAFNTYGPAEVTVVSTIREFGNEHRSIKSANVGWPMDSVSVFVTKNQRVIMKNAVGELALGGPQLSPGYLKQEDVTKAKYVWNKEASQRLYYTGDLVRMLADGSLEFMSRSDDLVKLGGIRVELSEISFALRGCHPLVGIIETFVLSRQDRPTPVLVAFLSAPGAAGTVPAGQLVLSQHVAVEVACAAANQARDALPEYMIPSVFLVVNVIPKTSSAKVDRRALQAAYESVDLDNWENKLHPEDPTGSQISEIEPRTSIATEVIAIVSALVNISPSTFTKTKRLRSLGLDSLRATRLASKMKEAGYGISVIEVLSCVTVHDLIRLATSVRGMDVANSRVFDVKAFNSVWHDVVAKKVKDEFVTVRATAIQESLLTETMSTYNMYWSNHFYSLDRSVDVSRLRQAWFAVCQKTEALRTGFIPVAEADKSIQNENLLFSLLQIIYRLPALDWEYHKCTQKDWRGVMERRIEDIMTRNQRDYFRHPPWAVTIFDRGQERIMVLTLHHSVHDEQSLQFIVDDVRVAYSYKPPLRPQMSDALSIILSGEGDYGEALKFWASELESFPNIDAAVWPDLTGKRVRAGVVPEYQLISEEVAMTEPVIMLESAAAKLGLRSMTSIIRAAWAFVSLGYLGLPATVFAETLSDRLLDTSLERNVGPLISVVPIPFHPKGSAREVLIEHDRLSVHSWKHRHVHARDIRKILKRPRGETLYPAVFNFHGASERPKNHSLPDIWREMQDQVGLHVEHAMAMNVFQRKNGSLTLEASADSRLISRGHLRVFVRQVDGLISSILKYPDESLASLVNHLPSNLRSISNRPISEEVASSIHTNPTYWLELYAKKQPDWVAVEVAKSITANGVKKEVMSYGKLNADSNRVAAFISSLGHKNRTVAVCSGRTMVSYSIIVGILKSGNAYLPIDEGLPADRKSFLIQDGDCPILFTETSLVSSFSGIADNCLVFCIDDSELPKSLAAMSPSDRDYASTHDDNAYLLFTSGSTGKPKGVMVTRGNLSSFIESFSEFTCEAAPRTLELGGAGRYLAQANRAFDPHLLEMFFPWRHGMATVTAPRPMILDDLELTLSKWDITHASFVPSLVDHSNITPEKCPSLIFMTVGGEKISQKVLDTWASTPQVAIANAYGPTEVTIGCTFAHIKEYTNLRNIGPPLTACIGHVLIPGTMDYTLIGQTGELCFTGDLVAKGYLNRPDATGFVAGPNGEKMYRTGDIGRLMSDGSVEYLGRGDDQTKIRGQRLELGEVSEVLRSSSVTEIDVVTTVAKHPGLARVQLISFVARSDSRQQKKAQNEPVDLLYSDFVTLGRELQDICRKKLPGYMVPDLIVPISFIPFAQLSGKANIKELHELFAHIPLQTVLQGNKPTAVNGAAFERQLSPEEEAVVNEICQVVPGDPRSFRPLSNIFEIGVDSLSAISLSVRLRNIGYAATVARVMSNPVIEQLARLPRDSSPSKSQANVLSAQHQGLRDLESQYWKTPSSQLLPSEVVSVRPCLPLQEGLVARSINSDQDRLYVNHIILQLGDNLDARRLKESWQQVTDDNEIMRTVFAPLEKEIVQVVLSASSHELKWAENEYSSLEEAIYQHQQHQGQISRDIISNISRVPPVRFQLAKISGTEIPLALFISIHHALYDAESFSMLLDDISQRYEGKEVPQRGSPSAFIEHIYLQDTERAKQHWVQSMSGCHPTSLRADSTTIDKPMVTHLNLRSTLSEMERRSASLQTTVPILIQAVFALLLADTVGAPDVTYGIVLSGRTVSIPGATSVLLPCITTIPGRLDTRNLETVGDVVETVQRSNVRSLEFQHTSLRHIQRWLKTETPLFDCLFSYIRTPAPPKRTLWSELDSQMPSEYPLALEVEASHATDTVHLNCVFSSSFGPLYKGQELLEKMEAILSSIAAGENPSLETFHLSKSESLGVKKPNTLWDETIWSSVEKQIRGLTEAFCGLPSLHVTKGASFLSLGIDSVTAIQFANELRKAGHQVSSSEVMRFSCVGALAKRIEEISSKPQTNGVKRAKQAAIPASTYGKHIRPLGGNDSICAMFQCTPLQSGMITQTITSGGSVYVHPHSVLLNNTVDFDQLKVAFHQVVQKNDILRTSFHTIEDLGNSWVGAVHVNPALEWKEISLPSGVDVISKVATLVKFDNETSFGTPPIFPVLVNQPEGRILILIMHHALYDGASLPFIFEDLAAIYRGEPILERPQFSKMVEHVLNGEESSCEFWVDRLRGYRPAEISRLDDASTSSRMLLAEHPISLDLSKIIASCKGIEVTIQSIALLTYAKVFARLIGRRDVVFGQVLAGRSLSVPDADRTLGPLFNTVAQRVIFEPKFLSNAALALRVQQHTTDAQVHQHAPLRIIQNSLRRADEFNSASLFDSLFVFQKSAGLAGSDMETQDIWSPCNTENYAAQAEYKLNVEVDHERHGIVVRATCNSQYISQQMLDDFLDEFDTVFCDIIEHPTRCGTALPTGLAELPLKNILVEIQGSVVEDSSPLQHESVVRTVLAEVAGVNLDSITPRTTIFNIGLDSLSAIRVASLCRAKGLKTGVGDILLGNTLRGISQRIVPISAQQPATNGSLIKEHTLVEEKVLEKLHLEKDSVEEILPCLPGQFFHLTSWLKSGRKMLEPTWSFFSPERLDGDKLQEAWFKLRQRHSILRTCFAAVSPKEAVQVILKSPAHDTAETFKVIESSSPITELAKAQAHEEALKPSSLFTPPVRLRLLKASDRDGIVIIINHASYDAWTMPIFVSELEKIYRGQPLGTCPDFSSFVNHSVQALRELDEEAYWTSTLSSGAPTLIKSSEESPPQSSTQLFIGVWEKVKNLSQMEAECRSVGLSLQTVVLLAAARCIAQVTETENPIMGLYQTGRSASFNNIENLSGPCLNVNPLVVQDALSVESETQTDIIDLALAVQASLAERVSYEQSSLQDVLRWADAQAPGSPLFNTWINLLWTQSALPSANDVTPESDLKGDEALFLPLRIGVPTDFIPTEALPNLPTPVQDLDTTFLPDGNVFIDVGPDLKTDTIGFGVRVEGGILSENEVRQLVDNISWEIEGIVSALGDEHRRDH